MKLLSTGLTTENVATAASKLVNKKTIIKKINNFYYLLPTFLFNEKSRY